MLRQGTEAQRQEMLQEVVASANPTLFAAVLRDITTFPLPYRQDALRALDQAMQHPIDRERVDALLQGADKIPDQELRGFLTRYRTTIGEARNLGITRVFRFYPDTLQEVVTRRQQEQQGVIVRGPTAIMVMAQDDPRGAFAQRQEQLMQMAKQMNLLVYEVSHEEQLAQVLQARTPERRVDLIAIAGHGSQHAIALGAAEGAPGSPSYEKAFFDLSDLAELQRRGVGEVLRNGGQVLLESCSTGRGALSDTNMARELKEKLFPQSASGGVMAPLNPSAAMTIDYEVNSISVTYDSGTFKY